jgi:hypothetical protein
MPTTRVLATQQARDAAKQLLALTGPVKDQIGRVLQQGGILADPRQWDCSLAGKWRNDWGHDANHLRQTAAKLNEVEHKAHQVVEDIFKADNAPLGAPPAGVPPLGRKSPEEILTEYQVSPDPKGTTSYPPFPLSLAVHPHVITKTEAEMLDALGLLGQKDFHDLQNRAYDTADQRFPNQGREDGHNDAFRHAYWNALMVKEYGADWATRFATAHERLPGNQTDREAMDLYNNELGRQVAIAHPNVSREELANLVEQAVRNGDAVVIDGNGNLVYSNTVPPGQTGEADDPPTEGGKDPDSAGASGGSDASGTGSSHYDSGGS